AQPCRPRHGTSTQVWPSQTSARSAPEQAIWSATRHGAPADGLFRHAIMDRTKINACVAAGLRTWLNTLFERGAGRRSRRRSSLPQTYAPLGSSASRLEEERTAALDARVPAWGTRAKVHDRFGSVAGLVAGPFKQYGVFSVGGAICQRFPVLRGRGPQTTTAGGSS
ncbi:MAG: hypothetical protein M3O36_21205, partial [Myxococcota bacterium]|nr:hypothetical protein [Myxococcota bacterium]